jgi:aminocarboxymuconate-semialdehyde decarboxylase
VSLVVDVHAHTLVPAAELLVSREPAFVEHQTSERHMFGAASRWLRPLVDLDTRLSTMDAAGVDIQAVSVVPWQYYYWADHTLAAELVDVLNGEIASLTRQAPDRLVGVGTVGLQHPDLAADQLRRAVDDYGFRGVQISTAAGGRDLSHPDFDPFWSIAESLGVVAFIHPWGCGLGDRLATAHLADVLGGPIEITVALSHVVFGGVLDRFPGLTVCATHGGGYFLQSLGRADHTYDQRPERRTTARRPRDYLSRLYFDSLVHGDDALRHLVDTASPDRVLMGTDYPFEIGADGPASHVGLSSRERDAISGRNARSLLRLGSGQSLDEAVEEVGGVPPRESGGRRDDGREPV